MRIKIDQHPYDEDQKLFDTEYITLKPGINSLVGCNGSGKSTFINAFLIPYLEKHKIDYYSYNDRIHGGHTLMEEYTLKGNTNGLARMFISSEGERIVEGLGKTFSLLRYKIQNSKDKFVLIFDAIDSGMSVDEIIEIREIINNTVIPDAESMDKELYIVIAANNYEWCKDVRNINIITGKELKINSYDDFRDIIQISRKYKDNRTV